MKRNIFYLTGSQGTGKTKFVKALTNSLEIEQSILEKEGLDESINYLTYESIVVTGQHYDNNIHDFLLKLSVENNRHFFDVKLTINDTFKN